MFSSSNPFDVAKTLYHNLPRPGEEFITAGARWKFVALFASNLLNGELYNYPDKPRHPDYAMWRSVYEIASEQIIAFNTNTRAVSNGTPSTNLVSVQDPDFNPLDAIDELRDAVNREEN